MDLVRTYRLGRLGAFTYSPEEGTSGFELEGRVPTSVAAERRDAVLAARDEVLREEQGSLVGKPLQVLVDEAPSEGWAVARPDMDAPEVDLVAFVEAEDGELEVGQRIEVRVTEVDEDHNLLTERVGGE